MTPATNEPPEDVNIGFPLPTEMLKSLADRAKDNGMDVPSYTRLVICSYLRTQPESSERDYRRKEADNPSLNNPRLAIRG